MLSGVALAGAISGAIRGKAPGFTQQEAGQGIQRENSTQRRKGAKAQKGKDKAPGFTQQEAGLGTRERIQRKGAPSSRLAPLPRGTHLALHAGRGTRPARLERPLDFVALTDHADFQGEVALCTRPGSPAYESEACRIYRGDGQRGDVDPISSGARMGKLATIPVSVFYAEDPGHRVLRVCFAKDDATLDQAADILCAL